jgi:hypothetical protein
MNAGLSSFRASGMTTVLIGGIRAVNWCLLMGIAVPMLYVVPVLVSSWIQRSRTILLTVAIDEAPSPLPSDRALQPVLRRGRDLDNRHSLHAASTG